MTFRNPFLNWLAQHPGQAAFALIGFAILLAALSPLFFYALPIRKVPLVYNLRNLQNRWKTTLVTALAFTLVTALLTFMLSFVKGLDRLIETSGHPGNIMVLSDGATDEAFSNLPAFTPEELPQQLQAGIVKMQTDPDPAKPTEYMVSQEVYVIVMYMIPNSSAGGRERRFVQMRGMRDLVIAAAVHDVKLGQGQWPGAPGVKEIVIGPGMARAFGADVGKAMLDVGDSVVLGKDSWTVVGILEEGSASFSSEIWTSALAVQDAFGRKDSYCSYVIRTEGPEQAKLGAKVIKELTVVRTLQAFTEREYYAKMSNTSKEFAVAAYVVAFVMAIGGVLGIMNTMYAAISQRSKDIGVLRLMGYRRWQILLSFQFESLVIALLGGVLGCAVAYLVFDGQTATSMISSGAGGGGKTVILRITFDFAVLMSGLIFSVMMGGIGGLLPSMSAMRLRPLESLK